MNTTTITHTPATKVSITITPHQLWRNFMANWTEMNWEEFHVGREATRLIDNVARALISPEPLNPIAVRQLFKDGSTMLLLDSASMTAIDQPNTLIEIIVINGDQRILIPHKYIHY